MKNGVNSIDLEWFSSLLKERKLSQRQLAKKCGMNAGALSMVLSGKQRVTDEMRKMWAVAMGVPLIDILIHTGYPELRAYNPDKVVQLFVNGQMIFNKNLT